MTFEEFFSEWRDNRDYIMALSSGSTGNPKTIFLSKKFVIESALRTNNYFGINSNSKLHSCVSPDFIGGKMMAVRAEISGAKLTWEIPSNQPLKDVDSFNPIDLLAVVPSQMLYIIEHQNLLPEIRNIIIGGSSIHPHLKEKIVESGLRSYETYGMTETASHIALRKVSKENIPFHTLPGIEVSVDNESCLKIKFKDGSEFITNDIAEVISSTEFFIKGRRDYILITGGKKINPVEIEEKIVPYIDRPFCISGVPDEKWGEKLVLLIEDPELAERNHDNKFIDDSCKTKVSKNSADLIKKLKSILKSWMVPKEIIYLPSLPRTSNGKIKRKG